MIYPWYMHVYLPFSCILYALFTAFSSAILAHLFSSFAACACRCRLSSVVCQDASPVVPTLYCCPWAPHIHMLHAAPSLHVLQCDMCFLCCIFVGLPTIFLLLFSTCEIELCILAQRGSYKRNAIRFFVFVSFLFSAASTFNAALDLWRPPSKSIAPFLHILCLWRCFDTANARACL